MKFRAFLTLTVLFLLLIWGPIDHSWPYWLAVRIGYLVLVPLLVWALVGWLWARWSPSAKREHSLNCILSGLISIALLAFAFLEATSKTHVGNTQWIGTQNGMEAVGDDIVLHGPDYTNVFLLTVFALLFFGLGVLRKRPKPQNHQSQG